MRAPPDVGEHRAFLLLKVSAKNIELARKTVTIWLLPCRFSSARQPRLSLMLTGHEDGKIGEGCSVRDRSLRFVPRSLSLLIRSSSSRETMPAPESKVEMFASVKTVSQESRTSYLTLRRHPYRIVLRESGE